LSHDDRLLAERLREAGIVLHTTPQARTRLPYDGRPACVNYGTCDVCPIGARYSPNGHLNEAVASGLCELRTEASVRRIIPGSGTAPAVVVYQPNDAAAPSELAARAVVVACGAIESIRLLLLSTGGRFPNGVGNHSGRLGQGFTFTHAWWNDLYYSERLYAGRFGGWTGQSHQFVNAERGAHGAIKIIFSSRTEVGRTREPGTAAETLRRIDPRAHSRPITFAAETVPSPNKWIALSTERDRFGDPFAHLNYRSDSFDHRTHDFARTLNDRFVEATGAEPRPLDADPERFGSGAHHMGGCAMGTEPGNSVVDPFGAIHGAPDIFVAGGSVFPGSSGAMNPTLTMTALALRTADRLLESL
jgi:choline dehydrogenase-like flavoprotein